MASCARLARIEDLPGINLIHVTPRNEIVEAPAKCMFEEIVEELGLENESIPQLASAKSYKHIQLRLWCCKNAAKRYVPTELLAAWGIEVNDQDFYYTSI